MVGHIQDDSLLKWNNWGDVHYGHSEKRSLSVGCGRLGMRLSHGGIKERKDYEKRKFIHQINQSSAMELNNSFIITIKGGGGGSTSRLANSTMKTRDDLFILDMDSGQ